MRIDSMPGVTPENRKPANLFDVKVPEITFRYPVEMQHFIEDTVQFINVERKVGARDHPAFPMPPPGTPVLVR